MIIIGGATRCRPTSRVDEFRKFQKETAILMHVDTACTSRSFSSDLWPSTFIAVEPRYMVFVKINPFCFFRFCETLELMSLIISSCNINRYIIFVIISSDSVTHWA